MKNTLLAVVSRRIYLVDGFSPFHHHVNLFFPVCLTLTRPPTIRKIPHKYYFPRFQGFEMNFPWELKSDPFLLPTEHEEQLCISLTKAEWLSFTDPGEECQQVNVVLVPTKETMGSRLLIRAFCICALTTLGVTDAVHHTFFRVEFLAIPEGSC